MQAIVAASNAGSRAINVRRDIRASLRWQESSTGNAAVLRGPRRERLFSFPDVRLLDCIETLMDIDPMESATDASDDSSSGEHASRLGARVAVTVALIATFLGICKVKDDNIVQAMQQAQADKLDHWNFYQARNIREEVAASTVAQLKLALAGAPSAQQA